MNTTTRPMRGATLVIGTALGAVSAAAGYANGSTLGSTTFSQTLFGVGFVAIIAITWVLPSYFQSFLDQRAYMAALATGAAFILFVVLVICNTIGYTATHRADGVAGRQHSAEAYGRAGKALDSVNIELTAAREAKIFKRTASCGNDTEELSKIFCARFRALEERRKQAEAILADRPVPADAQAEQLAWIFGVEEKTAKSGWTAALGIAFEIGAILAFWLAAQTGMQMPAPPSPQEPARASVEIRAIEVAETPASPVLAIAGPSQTVSKSHRLGKPETRVRINLDGTFHKGDLARIRKAEQK
jgi:hypothetical protein